MNATEVFVIKVENNRFLLLCHICLKAVNSKHSKLGWMEFQATWFNGMFPCRWSFPTAEEVELEEPFQPKPVHVTKIFLSLWNVYLSNNYSDILVIL